MLKVTEFPKTGFGFYVKKPIPVRVVQMTEPFQIDTLEGTMTGKAGDYLIEGYAKELYGCDKNIFERTYKQWKPRKK